MNFTNPYEELKELAKKVKENCEENQRSLIEAFYKNAFDSIKSQLENISTRKDSFNTDLCKPEIPFKVNHEDAIEFFVSKGFSKKSLSISSIPDKDCTRYYLTIDL